MSEITAALPRPSNGGLAGWLRPYFNPWPHALLTVAITGSLLYVLARFYRWAVTDAVFGQASPDDALKTASLLSSVTRTRRAPGASHVRVMGAPTVVLVGDALKLNDVGGPTVSIDSTLRASTPAALVAISSRVKGWSPCAVNWK